MNTMLLITTILAFVFSLIFALGGVGSALAFIPVMHWLGIPLEAARPVGLMINTVSMGGASVSNIANKRLDFRLAMPVIATSTIFAPAGAWCSMLVSKKTVMWSFTAFLVFSSLMLLIYNKQEKKQSHLQSQPVFKTALIGAGAGFLSGLLGVGGGMLISPMLIFLGFKPKQTAAITAFAVPFSSFIAFTAYAIMGTVNWQLIIFTSAAAYLGGITGTKIMHNHLKGKTVKKLLGLILLGMAIKIISGLI